MAIEDLAESMLIERKFEEEDREFQMRLKHMEEAHQQRMLEIKVVEQSKARAATRRVDATERVLVGIVKLPAVLILALAIPVLVLARREVPVFIQEFINF